MTNRTYRYFSGQALFPFGHGLSYTNLRVTPTSRGVLSVELEVSNIGDRAGDEVIQIYAVPPAARERQSLCAFTRVHLARGETRTVHMTVPEAALRRWDTTGNRHEVRSGRWILRAGASSADIRQIATADL